MTYCTSHHSSSSFHSQSSQTFEPWQLEQPSTSSARTSKASTKITKCTSTGAEIPKQLSNGLRTSTSLSQPIEATTPNTSLLSSCAQAAGTLESTDSTTPTPPGGASCQSMPTATKSGSTISTSMAQSLTDLSNVTTMKTASSALPITLRINRYSSSTNLYTMSYTNQRTTTKRRRISLDQLIKRKYAELDPIERTRVAIKLMNQGIQPTMPRP